MDKSHHKNIGALGGTHYETSIDRVLIGDRVAELEKLPANSVDVIFADPPYNLSLPANFIALTTPASTASMPHGTTLPETAMIRSRAFQPMMLSLANGWPPRAGY